MCCPLHVSLRRPLSSLVSQFTEQFSKALAAPDVMQTPLPQPCGEAAPCAGQPSAADDAAMEGEEEVFQTQLPECWDRPYHHATDGACAAPCASPLHAQLQDAHKRHEEVQGFLGSALHHMAQQHQTILSLEAGLQDRARWATQWGQQQLHAAAEQEAWEAHEHRVAAEQEAWEAHGTALRRSRQHGRRTSTARRRGPRKRRRRGQRRRSGSAHEARRWTSSALRWPVRWQRRRR